MESDPVLASLQPMLVAGLSRRFHRHYRGFAHSQRLAFDEKPTAKRLLYVIRTALTGTHLLRTGRLVIDVRGLLDEYGFGEARALIAAKARGEQSVLAGEMVERWRGRIDEVFATLDAAERASTLPEEPSRDARDAIEGWLLSLRRDRWEAAH